MTECSGKPDHSLWNGADSYTQTYTDGAWSAEISTQYSEEEGACRYKCEDGFDFYNGSCELPETICGLEGNRWDEGHCCPGEAFWDNSSSTCLNPCTSNPCPSIAGFDTTCKPLNPTERYCINKDSTTGLIWSSKTEKNWNDAIDYCENDDEGGFTDWHLPNIDELKTLLIAERITNNCLVSDKNNCLSSTCWSCSTCTETGTPMSSEITTCSDYGLATSDGRYSKFGETGYFWSSSKDPYSPEHAWVAGFKYGELGVSGKTHPYYVRCARCESGYFWNGTACEVLPECSPSNTGPCFDSESKLIWSEKAEGNLTWEDGVSYCENLTEGGYTDWHLSTISELRTLVQNCQKTETGGICGVTDNCLSDSCWIENDCFCPYDSTGGYNRFGDTGWFWSLSPTDRQNYMWTLYFASGNVSKTQVHRDVKGYVRCTRNDDDPTTLCILAGGIMKADGTCTKNVNCSEKPAHTEWNGESYYPQTYTDGVWSGETFETEYNTEIGTCHYKCEENYFWDTDTQACINPCDSTPCNVDTLPGFISRICKPYSTTEYSCGGQNTTTDLFWSTRSHDEMDWNAANSYCNDLVEGGSSDWHLPDIDELKTILNANRISNNCLVSTSCTTNTCWSCSTCTETGTQLATGNGCSYWGTEYHDGRYSKFGETGSLFSSTISGDDPNFVWLADFEIGVLSTASIAIDITAYVRCVRCWTGYHWSSTELHCTAD